MELNPNSNPPTPTPTLTPTLTLPEDLERLERRLGQSLRGSEEAVMLTAATAKWVEAVRAPHRRIESSTDAALVLQVCSPLNSLLHL